MDVRNARQRIREHLARRAEWYWAPALYAAVVAILYHQVWSGEQGFGWDTIESYWPDLAFFSDQISAGDWPRWNPFDRGGYPIVGDPQAALYYPVQWLLAGFGAAAGGVGWWLIQIKMLAHHALAATLMHAFCRSRGLPKTAAIVAGVAWIGCAPWLIHKASNVLLPMAWVPLLWIAADRAADKPCWRTGCLLAAALYLPASAGSPPGFFYTLVAGGAYGAFRFVQRAVIEPRKLNQLAVCVAVAGAVAIALLVVVMFPGFELAEHTTRAKRGLAYALSFPLPAKTTLIGLVSPSTGKMDSYMGILVAMLAICGLALRPLRDRGAPILLGAVALVFLLLAFGEATPLLRWLVNSVPGFGLFRIANRYKLPFAIAVAALAGYGAANLLEAARSWSRERITAIAVAAVMFALAAYCATSFPITDKVLRAPKTALVFGAIAASFVIAAALHKRRGALLLVAVMPLLILYDADHYVHFRGPVMEKQPDHLEDRARLRDLEGVPDEWRIYDEFVLAQRVGSRLSVRDFRGYPSGDPLDLARYRRILAEVEKAPQILAAYNVRYILHGPHHRNGRAKNYIKRPPDRLAPNAIRRIDAQRFELLRPLPRLAWYGGILVRPANQVVPAIVDTLDAPQRRRTVLEPGDASKLNDRTALEGADRPYVAGTIERDELESIRGVIDAPAPGIAVLNEIAYPGWVPYIDGRREPPLIADYALRAVHIPAGRHAIEWRFEPPSLHAYQLLWWLGVLVLVVAWRWPSVAGAIENFRARRRPS